MRTAASPIETEGRDAVPLVPEDNGYFAGLAAGVGRGDLYCFRLDGELWTLTFAGRTVRLPDSKGLRDLHTLLSQQGREVPAEALVDPDKWRDAARSKAAV